MGESTAIKRLRKEYQKLLKEPINGIEAHPDEDNILTWYYVLIPTSWPYRGGVYMGKLVFPKEYPFKPPDIYMMTPSGRFEINRKLCMSMSSYHPESWDPWWGVVTIVLGILSFMYES